MFQGCVPLWTELISQKVNKFSMFQQLKYTDREEENICMVYAYLYLFLEVDNLSLRLPSKNKYRKLLMNLFILWYHIRNNW